MAKTKVSEYSSTASSNTDINNINIAEGCAPSGINDAIRTLMAQLKDWQSGAVAQDNNFNGSVTISGPTILSSTLAVTGASSLNGNLLVGGGATFSGNVVMSANLTLDSQRVGYRDIPQNSQSAAYTLVAADAGKHILHPSADTTARTFTIPSNSNVPFPIGTAVTFINQNGAGVVTIAITADTMRLAGTGTTGSRTLAGNGIATAVKIASTEWIISGQGLT